MTDQAALVREKLDQAPSILEEHGVDLWLTLVRETLLTRDPCLDLIAGVLRVAKRVPAVALGRADRDRGRYDAPSVEQLGAYSEVQGYDESIRPGLRETIERFAPETIALNYSPSDPAADGLTHGLWLVLLETWRARRTPIGWSRPSPSSGHCAGGSHRSRSPGSAPRSRRRKRSLRTPETGSGPA